MAFPDGMASTVAMRRRAFTGSRIALSRKKALKRLLLASALGAIALTATTAYVTLPAGRNLLAARAALEAAGLEGAAGHLAVARRRLSSPTSRLLQAVPVVGPNLRVLEAVAEGALPVARTGVRLDAALTSLRKEGLLTGRRLSADRLAHVEKLVTRAHAGLSDLAAALTERRSGWLLPPLWDAATEAAWRTEDLAERAAQALALLRHSDGVLGLASGRTYLVIALNNAELRGSGGLGSAYGLVHFRKGEVDLGPFFTTQRLVRSPARRVNAPRDYERRFDVYKANTTSWSNVTFSPDFADVALVAARLFEKVKGTPTDGAIQVDPRGLAALMPEDAAIPVPETDRVLGRKDIADWIYSRSYEEIPDPARRRAVTLRVSRRALATALRRGIVGGSLDEAAAAFAGGHLRFVSFRRDESSALARGGFSGDLSPPSHDDMLVAVQNFGGGGRRGNKLDYWARRRIRHRCAVGPGGSAACTTRVTLSNQAPAELPLYVSGRPYALLRSLVELYVPSHAEIEGVWRDGEPIAFYPDAQSGRTVLGVYIEVERGASASVRVDYSLPPAPRYELVATPQPLARDAHIDLALEVPDGWTVRGIEPPRRAGWASFSGAFDRTLRVEAAPDDKTGIPAIWDGLVGFWRKPLFG